MKRTFIAIKIVPNETLRSLLGELKDSLSGSRIKWVEEWNYHLTLSFIGNTGDTEIDRIQEILSSTCGKHKSFTLIFRNIDLFKSLKDPRVIFLGIEPSTELAGLREDICNKLSTEGLFNDKRPFKPHLTLGRPKYLEEKDFLSALISENRDRVIQKSMIDKVIYYESILKEKGPVYRVIGEYTLTGGIT